MVWKKIYAFDILNDISEDANLVQLMGSLGNVNRAISIVGHWIFDFNYDKSLFLNTIIIGYNMLSFHWRRTNSKVSICILCC